MDEKSFKRGGTGTYTARVVNYSGFALSYTITFEIWDAVPLNGTVEDGNATASL